MLGELVWDIGDLELGLARDGMGENWRGCGHPDFN